MLRKTLITIILFSLSGWGIFKYVSSHEDSHLTKVFSSFNLIGPLKEVGPINSEDIVEETNKERIANDLPPLSINTKLEDSALVKANDIIKRQYFEHTAPTGEGVSDLGKDAGYQYVILGENLALGDFSSSKDIVEAWMKSPGHRANILNTRYQDIGVGIVRGVYEGKSVWVAVQHFGTSRNVCPSIDTSLKWDIDRLNQELKEEEGIINMLKKSLESPEAGSDPSYQNRVALFNSKVEAYNAKLSISREKINYYNKEVRAFNSCIATFQ